MAADPRLRPAGRHFRQPRRVRKRLVALFSAVVLVIAAIVGVAAVRSVPFSGTAVPVPAAIQETPVAVAPASLQDRIDAVLAEDTGYRIGLVLADVSGDAALAFGDMDEFAAASTAKIITAAAYYHLVETGKADLSGPLGDYDAAFQLEAMVNQSNNDSWLLLMDAVGYPELTGYAASIGVTYDPEENRLAPADMALVLKKLYAGDLLDEDHTAQLLGYMQETNNEDLIPAGSQAGVDVFHKYGELGGALHDAAVLSYRGSAFVLVIYTENPEGMELPGQSEVIRRLTGIVEESLFPPVQPGALGR
ncbi:beta-lactamase class A [Pseudarthrobacter oxydans]|uniref:Beta-lactamase class A n=1 Tax=Pseudarthrobacter oxydans TaxID=1671 RepID=A0AAW8NBW7_PSEOX|nr:serine hydrolase [Pseudarthrobacter oxydans]MDR6792958.1 beta-lactamase class A [Pseudarthrobacter oxydans]MDR7163844.1 beta-lactamase class A [Pseudarthrobacter oxydans]